MWYVSSWVQFSCESIILSAESFGLPSGNRDHFTLSFHVCSILDSSLLPNSSGSTWQNQMKWWWWHEASLCSSRAWRNCSWRFCFPHDAFCVGHTLSPLFCDCLLMDCLLLPHPIFKGVFFPYQEGMSILYPFSTTSDIIIDFYYF